MHPLLQQSLPASSAYRYKTDEYFRERMLHITSAGHCVYGRRTQIAHRVPGSHLLGIVQDGEVRFMAGEAIYAAHRSDIIILPAKVARRFISREGFELLWVEFGGPPAEAYRKMIIDTCPSAAAVPENAELFTSAQFNDPNVLIMRSENLQSIRTVLGSTIDTLRSTQQGADASLSLAITTILTHLCGRTEESHPDSETEKIDHALQDILRRLSDPPTVSEMAEHAGFSESHFIRVFTRLTGTTPRQYIISARMEHSKHLLHSTQLPLRTIANMIGYTSESMFCATFKKAAGITAKEFRNRYTDMDYPDTCGYFPALRSAIINGNTTDIIPVLRKLTAAGVSTRQIMDRMTETMSVLIERFFRQETLISELLAAVRVLRKGLTFLKPFLPESNIGKVVVGTVKGETHDIGKNLSALMLETMGFEIIDLGTDIAAETFVEACIKHPEVHIVTLSAMMTASQISLANTVRCLNAQPFRNRIRIITGGSAVTEAFAASVGADAYSPDVVSTARIAYSLVSETI